MDRGPKKFQHRTAGRLNQYCWSGFRKGDRFCALARITRGVQTGRGGNEKEA